MTNSTDPDRDGDGYWDGWLGVYGLNRSDNVILYREHLQDGDGIEGDEIFRNRLEPIPHVGGVVAKRFTNVSLHTPGRFKLHPE